MIYLNDFIALGLISLLAAISPGPDFVIVAQNSLLHGKRVGIYTALGVALGCTIHITYCVIGIAVIVAESIIAFNIIKYLGAAYLIYIGVKGLLAKKASADVLLTQSNHTIKELSSLRAVRNGFLVNVLNPKATLFFLSMLLK
ncbi:MAG: LysE family translocator [Candidatus Berkiellales bacterium]